MGSQPAQTVDPLWAPPQPGLPCGAAPPHSKRRGFGTRGPQTVDPLWAPPPVDGDPPHSGCLWVCHAVCLRALRWDPNAGLRPLWVGPQTVDPLWAPPPVYGDPTHSGYIPVLIPHVKNTGGRQGLGLDPATSCPTVERLVNWAGDLVA